MIFQEKESADKPGSVVDSHSSGDSVAGDLKQPTRELIWADSNAPLFGLAPSGVYPASVVTNTAVRSYRTISPLPDESGGIFSVALSVGSRPPGVTWHPALWSPDFPPSLKDSATVWPTPGPRLLALQDRWKLHRPGATSNTLRGGARR